MRRVSLLLLILAVALLVSACGKDEPELSYIYPGLYEINHDIKYSGQLVILKQRVRYHADGTFEATNFQNNAAIEEMKGKYKVENKKLISYDTQRRLITQARSTTLDNTSSRAIPVRRARLRAYAAQMAASTATLPNAARASRRYLRSAGRRRARRRCP